jgi:mannosyltransferase
MVSDDGPTVLLRPPPQTQTRDLWDGLVRLARRRVDYDTTRTLARRSGPWLVPTVLTGLLSAVGLTRPGLWTDELATWGMARTPWHEFWPVLRYVDAVLAPYYVLMHAWVSVFGDSDLALRIPSLLAMAAAAALTGALGARLAGPGAGLLAGIVFGLLPSTSRFGAEARPYALVVFAAVAATYLLLRAWERPTAVRWAGYAGAVAVLSLLHVVAVLLLVAHAWMVAVWHRSVWRRFLTAAIGSAVSAPLLVYGLGQRHQVAYIPRVSFYILGSYPKVVIGSTAIALLIITLAMFSLPLRFPSAIFTIWAVVPAVALVVVSLGLPMFLPRYLLYTTPGWALLAGVALARLRPAWSIVALLVIAAFGLPGQLAMREPGGHDQATRQMAGIVASQARAGDVVMYADDEPIGSWTGRDAIEHYVPTSSRPRDALETHPPRTAGLLLATEGTDVAASLTGTRRVWLVRIGQLPDPLAGIGAAKETVLRDQFQVTQLWYPTGLTVALLQRRPAPS